MKLDRITRKLQAVLAGAVSTNQPNFTVSYVDNEGGNVINQGTQMGDLNGTTAVDILDALGGNEGNPSRRDVTYASVYNADTAQVTVTVRYMDNVTARPIIKVALETLETLEYSASGWRTLTASGGVKQSGSFVGTSFGDSVQLKFGDGQDVTMAWDGTDFDVLQATPNSSIKWGIDGAGIDQVWYGDTASQSMTWDQSVDDLLFTSLVGIAGAGSTRNPMYTTTVQQALSGAGAINVTTAFTAWTTTGADAGTLADGAQIGQIKEIMLTVDGGDGTLTPSNLQDGTTITFSAIGDFVRLIWTGTEWAVIARYNQATASAATPVLA